MKVRSDYRYGLAASAFGLATTTFPGSAPSPTTRRRRNIDRCGLGLSKLRISLLLVGISLWSHRHHQLTSLAAKWPCGKRQVPNLWCTRALRRHDLSARMLPTQCQLVVDRTRQGPLKLWSKPQRDELALWNTANLVREIWLHTST